MAARNGAGNGKSKNGYSEVQQQIRVETRGEGAGPAVRVVLGHGEPGRDDIDLTHSFTGAIAHALWMARAGSDEQNWIDAEKLLERLLESQAQRPERRKTIKEEPVAGPLPESKLGGLRRRPVASGR